MLKEILKSKSNQNIDTKKYLRETYSRVIGETSMRNGTYSMGFPIYKWNGGNELGNALMRVRDIFKIIK